MPRPEAGHDLNLQIANLTSLPQRFYSTYLPAAMEAIEALRSKWVFEIKTTNPVSERDLNRWVVEMHQPGKKTSSYGLAADLPLAICRAIVGTQEIVPEVPEVDFDFDIEEQTPEEQARMDAAFAEARESANKLIKHLDSQVGIQRKWWWQ